jgi:hypothetical protein
MYNTAAKNAYNHTDGIKDKFIPKKNRTNGATKNTCISVAITLSAKGESEDCPFFTNILPIPHIAAESRA